jgi:hypothetical protein
MFNSQKNCKLNLENKNIAFELTKTIISHSNKKSRVFNNPTNFQKKKKNPDY